MVFRLAYNCLGRVLDGRHFHVLDGGAEYLVGVAADVLGVVHPHLVGVAHEVGVVPLAGGVVGPEGKAALVGVERLEHVLNEVRSSLLSMERR